MIVVPKNSLSISAFQNHLQTKPNLHIFIRQSQFIGTVSIWDTLYGIYNFGKQILLLRSEFPNPVTVFIIIY